MITKHIKNRELAYYFSAEILGALLGSVFVLLIIGSEANLVVASALLMAVIVVVVYTKGLRGYGGLLLVE